LLATAALRPPDTKPCLWCVGGLIASGKSSLAHALASDLGLPIVSSDRLRKSLLGVAPTHPLRDGVFAGHYSESATEGVYRELLRRAEATIACGRSVVVDASFRSAQERAAARAVAARAQVPFVMIECRVPEAVSKTRLAQRALGSSESDGRCEIFDGFAAQFEPMQELATEEHVVIDTSGSIEQSLSALRQLGIL
jgi:uncharacterized protein